MTIHSRTDTTFFPTKQVYVQTPQTVLRTATMGSGTERIGSSREETVAGGPEPVPVSPQSPSVAALPASRTGTTLGGGGGIRSGLKEGGGQPASLSDSGSLCPLCNPAVWSHHNRDSRAGMAEHLDQGVDTKRSIFPRMRSLTLGCVNPRSLAAAACVSSRASINFVSSIIKSARILRFSASSSLNPWSLNTFPVERRIRTAIYFSFSSRRRAATCF